MTTESLPDIVSLARLFEELPSSPHSKPAIVNIAYLYAAQNGMTADEAWWEIMRVVQCLPSISQELSKPGSVKVAEGMASSLCKVLSPDRLHLDTGTFISQNLSDIHFIRNVLPLFDDLKFDRNATLEKSGEILTEINRLKDKIGSSATISDATKTVLNRQLDLLVKCLDRFNSGGVGPFRDSAFTIYGRIRIELEEAESSTDKTVASTARGIIDDVIRIYGVIQVGGAIAHLTGPIISGFLEHHPKLAG